MVDQGADHRRGERSASCASTDLNGAQHEGVHLAPAIEVSERSAEGVAVAGRQGTGCAVPAQGNAPSGSYDMPVLDKRQLVRGEYPSNSRQAEGGLAVSVDERRPVGINKQARHLLGRAACNRFNNNHDTIVTGADSS